MTIYILKSVKQRFSSTGHKDLPPILTFHSWEQSYQSEKHLTVGMLYLV